MIRRFIAYRKRKAWDTPDSRALKLYAWTRHGLEPAWWEWPDDFYERVRFLEDIQAAVYRLEVEERAARQ